MIYTRTADANDVDGLAASLRPEDVSEIAAASGLPPEVALRRGLAASSKCFVGYLGPRHDFDTIGIYGVVPDPIERATGHVWMVATPALERHSVAFVRQSREALAELGKGFDLLTNWVDCRNTMHVRWLRWMGFTFLRKAPYGKAQLPFYEFVKTTCVIP